jgi:hypothetical protein
MKTLIFVGGFYHLAFAAFHIGFWKLFDWKRELPKLNPVNQGVMQILNLRLIFVFLVFAYVSFFHADELLTTGIGKFLLAAIALFWFARAIEQIVFFNLKRTISAAMFFIFLLGAVLYICPFLI